MNEQSDVLQAHSIALVFLSQDIPRTYQRMQRRRAENTHHTHGRVELAPSRNIS